MENEDPRFREAAEVYLYLDNNDKSGISLNTFRLKNFRHVQ